MSMTFDAVFYFTQNPDVRIAFNNGLIESAEQHFNLFGWKEDRDPNSTFDTSAYLAQNPDVLLANVNPFQHFLAFGAAEGRSPNATIPARNEFDTEAYAAANADLAEAGITTPEALYQHFVTFGFAESRPGVQTTNGTPITPTPADDDASATVVLDTSANTVQAATISAPVAVAPQTGNNVQTLNSTDKLTGTSATTDSLTAVLNNTEAAGVTPTMSGIETLKLSATATSIFSGANATYPSAEGCGLYA